MGAIQLQDCYRSYAHICDCMGMYCYKREWTRTKPRKGMALFAHSDNITGYYLSGRGISRAGMLMRRKTLRAVLPSMESFNVP
jgi:hypothetical protein